MLTLNRDPKSVGLQRQLHQRAKLFRKQPTAAEQILWQRLKGKAILGLRMRRQFPIDRYIVDFCCVKQKLVIEVDGEIHEHTLERDQNRDLVLSHYGFKVLRFSNAEIMQDIDHVIHKIKVQLTLPSLRQGEKDRG